MARPFHVAFEDNYIRANWDGINALCRFNGIPFDAAGEKIPRRWTMVRLPFAQQLGLLAPVLGRSARDYSASSDGMAESFDRSAPDARPAHQPM